MSESRPRNSAHQVSILPYTHSSWVQWWSLWTSCMIQCQSPDPGTQLTRLVSSLHPQLLGTVMESLNRLYDPVSESRPRNSAHQVSTLPTPTAPGYSDVPSLHPQLLGTVMESLNQLYDAVSESRPRNSAHQVSTLRTPAAPGYSDGVYGPAVWSCVRVQIQELCSPG